MHRCFSSSPLNHQQLKTTPKHSTWWLAEQFQYIHTMGYYTAIQRNKLLIQWFGWLSETLWWGKEASLRRLSILSFLLHPWRDKTTVTENRLVIRERKEIWLQRDGTNGYLGCWNCSESNYPVHFNHTSIKLHKIISVLLNAYLLLIMLYLLVL